MDSNSVLYQLMDIRMNGIMNEITNRDEEYQEISRSSDEYSGRLDALHLPKEVRLLIDRYISEQNAHSTCAIDHSMGCLPICSAFLTVWICFWEISRFQT